jgi:hypothetical protein
MLHPQTRYSQIEGTLSLAQYIGSSQWFVAFLRQAVLSAFSPVCVRDLSKNISHTVTVAEQMEREMESEFGGLRQPQMSGNQHSPKWGLLTSTSIPYRNS